MIKQSSVDLSFQTGKHLQTKNQSFEITRERERGKGLYPGIEGEVT